MDSHKAVHARLALVHEVEGLAVGALLAFLELAQGRIRVWAQERGRQGVLGRDAVDDLLGQHVARLLAHRLGGLHGGALGVNVQARNRGHTAAAPCP